MRGYLSFSILYLLRKKPMYGSQIADALQTRRFERPNPGTIYPALKALQEEGLIKPGGKGPSKVYRLTASGRRGLRDAAQYFVQAYGDIVDDFRRGRL
jgi:DNA-binding PadR family transcriptional regulator